MLRPSVFSRVALTAATFAAAIMAMPASASADTTRNCSAELVVAPEEGRKLTRRFNADATVTGYRPNAARVAARTKMTDCIKAHWLSKQAEQAPAQCGEEIDVYNYPFSALETEITAELCRLNPGMKATQAHMTVVTFGSKGCSMGAEDSAVVLPDMTMAVSCP